MKRNLGFYYQNQVYYLQIQLIKLLMHSSLSFTSNRQMGVSKKLDFQKDIIMPHIYANENFDLLKNNSYPVRHERKVITAKKAKVRSVVEAIVSKKQVEVSKKTPIYKHRLSKPVNQIKKKSSSTLPVFEPQNFTMDIDEKLNEKAMYYEEQSTAARQKMKQVMEKVNGKITSQAIANEMQQVNFYITQLSPPKKPAPMSIQEVFFSAEKPSAEAKGFVEQQQQKEAEWKLRNRRQINTRTQMTVKPRPKTAGEKSHSKSATKASSLSHYNSGIFRSNSLMNTRLNRIGVGSEVIENLKVSQRNCRQKQKIKNLFDLIQSNVVANNMDKTKMVGSMNKLGMLWKSEKQFLQTTRNVKVLQLSHETFNLLKSIRNHQSQMKKMDEGILKSSQPPKHIQDNLV